MPWRPKRAPFPWRTLLKVLLPIAVVAVAIEVGLTVVEQRRPDHQARRLKERAQLHLQLNQLDDAVRALDEAASLLPDDVEGRLLLARVHQARGRLAESEEALRAAHRLRPDDSLVTVPLARLLLDTGRPMEAAEVLEPALGAIRKVTDPLQRIDALLVAGRAAAAGGALLQAEALFREATRVGTAPVTQVAKAAVEAWLALADLLTRTGRLPAAREALGAARTYTPWDPRIALAAARVLELAGQTDEAVELLRPLVAAEAGPDLAAAAALGDVLLRADRVADVAALASRVEPTGAELAGTLRSAAALVGGDVAAARATAEAFAERLPLSPAARLAQGRAALAAGDVDGARLALEAASAAAPDLMEPALLLLELDERRDDAAAASARALRLLDRPGARPWALRALFTLGDPATLASARERLERASAARPGDLQLRVHLGLLRAAAGDPATAAADLDPLTSAPDLARAAATLADGPEGMLQATLAVEALAARLHAGGLAVAPDARPLLARVLERLERLSLAEAVASSLTDAGATALRVKIALRAGAMERAGELLESLRTGAPDDPALLAALGEVRLLQGRLPAAVELLERAAQGASASAEVRARLGRARALAGDRTRARADYAAARALAPKLPIAHEDHVLSVLLEGGGAAAATPLQAAADATGDARLALALLAVQAASGEARAALATAQRVPAPAAEWHGGLLLTALLAEAGDGQRARAIAQRLGAPPAVRDAACGRAHDPTTRRRLWEAAALEVQGFTTLALAHALEAQPADRQADALALWIAWNTADAAHQPQRAVELASRLRALCADDPRVALRAARARRSAGDLEGERALIRQVHERKLAEAEPALVCELGVAFERLKDDAAAEACYRRVLAQDPRSVVARNNLACLLGRSDARERRREGLVHAQAAVRLAPLAPEPLDTLGWLLHLVGDDRAAVPALERAAGRLPDHPTVRFHQAAALAGLGRRATARAVVAACLAYPPGWPEEREARALLERLGP